MSEEYKPEFNKISLPIDVKRDKISENTAPSYEIAVCLYEGLCRIERIIGS